jgi:hypothetical protein
MDLRLHFTTKGNALDQLCLQSLRKKKQVSRTVALTLGQTRSSVTVRLPKIQLLVTIAMLSHEARKVWIYSQSGS